MLPHLRRLWLRLVHAFRPERAESDLAREVASHLALLEDELVRRGMTREQAYTEARRMLGGAEKAKHEHRDARSFPWLDDLLIDAKYAIRRLRRRPGTTALAVVMLAVAVGLSTAMFTIVDALIIRPLPFPHAERLAYIAIGGDTGGRIEVDSAVLDAWQRGSAFERAEGASKFTTVVDTPAGPAAREGAIVTSGLFEMLDARPAYGRSFDRDAPRANEVLLSETFWRTAFLGDRSIVGQQIRLDGQTVVVIGIMPAGFRFPDWNTDVWRPGRLDSAAGGQTYRAFVRLASDIPEGDALRVATEAAYATGALDELPSTWRARRRPIVTAWFGDTYYQRAVPFLGGAVVLVALVLCANVSSLLLTRLRARRNEFRLCTALGASRGRLLRQALAESLMTGMSGAVLGVAIAAALVSVAATLLPQAFLARTLNPLSLDVRALLVASVVGLVATVVAGAVPAWLGTGARTGGNADGQLVERRGTETRRGRTTVRALLVAEVALACALLVGGTLLVRSFVNLSRIDRGFDPTGIVTLRISFEDLRARGPEARQAVAMALDEAVRSLPGVRQTVWSGGAPMDSGALYFSDWTTDLPGSQPVSLNVETFAVGQDYFDLYGVRLLKGRAFRPGDDSGVVIVGERLASAVWRDAEPVGRWLEWQGQRAQVVGVARETRRAVMDDGLDFADMYTPYLGRTWLPVLSVRCAGPCPSEGVLRQRIQAAGPGIVHAVTYLDDAFARDLEQPRASAALVLTFAVVALIASAGGLFGVLSYAVQERRREFGIRAAIGATPAAIAKVVYREGVIVGTLGLLIGGVIAAALASTLASLSYEAAASDPVNVAAVVLTLVATIFLALWRPARTAARTDPALLLKEE